MEITSAQYSEDMNSNRISIEAVIDGIPVSVPLDPANRHYDEIMRQVNDGTLTIQDAD